jgi:SsrA-binding protein
VKVQLGVGKGKEVGDKREDLKRRDDEREMKRVTMKFMKGR